MSRQARLLIIVLFVVVLGGVVVAFVLPTLNPNTTSTPPPIESQGAPPPAGETALPTWTPVPTVKIVVAIQRISRGVVIAPDMIGLRDWPEFAAPENAIIQPVDDNNQPTGDDIMKTDVIGQIARTDIVPEQPILRTYLVPDLAHLSTVGSDAAAVLPAGYVAVAVPVDRITSVAYAIQDGDRVDVIVSLLFVDVDEQFQTIQPNLVTLAQRADDGSIKVGTGIEGRLEAAAGNFGLAIVGPSEAQRPRLLTQRTIQEAIVIHVGDFPTDGKLFRFVPDTPTPAPVLEGTPTVPPSTVQATAVPPRPDIVTLGVTPQDAVILTWFIEAKLPITFALRAANDQSKVPTEPVTLQFIMDRYGVDVPGKTDYSIEPAVRSIRQLIAGNQIQLSNAPSSGGGG